MLTPFMQKQPHVAVVGATGAVGIEMLKTLEKRNFPVGKLTLLASARSAGKTLRFMGAQVTVQELTKDSFGGIDIALFSAGGSISKDFAPAAVQAGCVVVDNSSAFRQDDKVPLVVPEINAADVKQHQGIIANPNCSTIQMLVALKPIHDAVGIQRINVCTYQAVSGTGKEAIEELASQTAELLNGRPVKPVVYPRQIAFNVLPHIDVFQENGYTKEEMKMVWETRKIMEAPDIQVNPTAVRVPVFYGHSEAVHIETREKLTAKQATSLLKKAPGVVVLDKREDGGYPTAVTEGAGHDPVYVGRIREDISHQRGLDLWVVADNVRKGAALNSIQIAEILVKEYL